MKGNVADLLRPDSPAFNDFAAKVRADLESVLNNYQIEDKSTKRQLLDAQLSFEELDGRNEQGLRTIEEIRSLEEKPDAKLMAGLTDKAILEARLDSKASSGAAYQAAFARRFAAAVNALPWNVVQDRVKELKGRYEILSEPFIAGRLASGVQPMVEKSQAVDNQSAWQLLNVRRAALYIIPLKGHATETLEAYVVAHAVVKPDIWEARDVTLSASGKLTPVLIGIWDSGVDVSNFPKQLYSDPMPDWHDPRGLAFDDQGGHSKSLLLPIPETELKAYTPFLPTLKGMQDQASSVDTPEASAFRQKAASMPPDQSRALFDRLKLYDPYIHGTHVAGISVRGNPAARLVVFRFNDQLPDLTFAPTTAWAHRLAADFREIGEYCRTHHVRVVNMSWGDQPSEFETWLSKTGQGKDAADRKKAGAGIVRYLEGGYCRCHKSAPGTLFICAAGNSNSNPGFDQDVPPSLHLPNLIAVGAVNKPATKLRLPATAIRSSWTPMATTWKATFPAGPG